MDELGRFLAQLGLGQHEAALRANDIDMDVLRILSEADLRELGIVQIGGAFLGQM